MSLCFVVAQIHWIVVAQQNLPSSLIQLHTLIVSKRPETEIKLPLLPTSAELYLL